MTKTEREAFAKNLYYEYINNEHLSYESLGHKYSKSTSTIFRLVNRHKALVEAGAA